MPDIIDLITNWKKQILVVVTISLLAVGIVTFLKQRQYLSIATAVPASSFATDKSKIFNGNIDALYSALGTTDDLDMIVGTANLDTVYLAVTDRFNLFDHYKIAKKGDSVSKLRDRAASILRVHTRVMKSEYGELKVKVWDTDKNLAPQLANAILDELQLIHQNLRGAGNEAELKGLRSGLEKIKKQIDSTGGGTGEKTTAGNQVWQDQLQQYEKLIGEYQLMIDSKPPVLVVVEKAKASARPDKPRRIRIMVATFVLSFLFALFAALVMERRKIVGQ